MHLLDVYHTVIVLISAFFLDFKVFKGKLQVVRLRFLRLL